jgi:hypothetical protein
MTRRRHARPPKTALQISRPADRFARAALPERRPPIRFSWPTSRRGLLLAWFLSHMAEDNAFGGLTNGSGRRFSRQLTGVKQPRLWLGRAAANDPSRKSSSKICCDAQHCWLADNWEALGSNLVTLFERVSPSFRRHVCENGHIALRSRSALYELHSNAVETPNAVR